MLVAYNLADCPLGRLLVASTGRGVCAVSIAHADEALEATLRQALPSATFRCDDRLHGWTRVILAFFHGQPIPRDLPIDVRGTAFQQRVWEGLRDIPYGETRSYGDVARAVGKPDAARAVANACAANPVPLVVPCHRVVRSTGDPGGYGLGPFRKRALLSQERPSGGTAMAP